MSGIKKLLLTLGLIFALAASSGISAFAAIAKIAEDTDQDVTIFAEDGAIVPAVIDTDENLAGAAGVGNIEDGAPPEVSQILGNASVSGADVDTALQKIWRFAMNNLTGILRTGVKSAAMLLVIVMLVSLADSMLDNSAAAAYVPLGGALAVSAVAAADISAFIGLGGETLTKLSEFSKLLLPGLAACSAASGAITGASAKYLAASMFMGLLISAAKTIILPMIYAYTASVIAGAAFGGSALEGVTKLLKWLCVSLLTILVLAFTLYLTITGILTGTADAMTTKVAKTTISTVLPVVGSIISDAAGTILTGAAMLRNGLGIFGLLTVICVCLIPFLRLGVQYIMYKAAAGLASALSTSRLSSLINGIGGALGMVMALVGSGAIILFVSIISTLKAVGMA